MSYVLSDYALLILAANGLPVFRKIRRRLEKNPYTRRWLSETEYRADISLLIVDDEADIVSTLADYFLYNDYHVMTATNGMEAIEKAGKQPDLILLDINLPDVDGLEVCARIRDFVSCPILFLTARVEDRDKVKGFGMGWDAMQQDGGSIFSKAPQTAGVVVNRGLRIAAPYLQKQFYLLQQFPWGTSNSGLKA